LTHTSGIFDHAQSDQFFEAIAGDPQKEWTRTEQIQGAVDWGDAYGAPGELFSYSDTGYILLGEVIEKITGKSLAVATHEAIAYEKLGMEATWWELREQPPKGVKPRAHQYLDSFDTYDFNPTLDINGGGGIVSTTGDLAVFFDQLFARNIFDNPATLDTMIAMVKSKVPNEPFNDYRMGLYTRTIKELRAYEHSGFWGTEALYFPDYNLSVTLAVTQQNQFRVLFHVLDKVLEQIALLKSDER
ncbi:MAG: serine hydrolase domain-containing protein, partial [Pseudomonadales bacterium]